MLVLSRKVGTKIRIGDNIVITIKRISGDRVSIGFEAPSEVTIVRGELERHAAPIAPVAAPHTYVPQV